MMAEALGVDKRSTRSRSKTPNILFGENGDSGKKGAKVIPTISLIEEEDDIVEVIPSQARRKRRAKNATSDVSGEAVESPKNSQSKEVASKKSVTTTTVTETIKKTTNGSGESSTTTSVTKTALSDATEVPESQSIFNNIFNAIKTSTPILSSKRSKRTIDTSSSTVNVADHPAYKEYKEAGEYWNKYPKTDYTYSELSPHRRELSNGAVAMPNMSRRSLDKYTNRVEVMIQNNPADESFIRRKYLSNSNSSFQKRSADLQYDSADEVDVSEFRKQLQARRAPKNIVSRFFVTLISYFYSAYYSVKENTSKIFYRSSSSRYVYTPVRKQKGVVGQALNSIKKFFLLGFSKVYLFVSTILCLDTWILYTRSENADKNQKRRKFLLGLLIFLPLLLFTAWLLSDDSEAIKFYNITSFDLQSLKNAYAGLPTLRVPQIDLSFSFDWLWLPFVSLGAGMKSFLFTRTPKEELKLALDEETLKTLLAHIDNYIDASIIQQFETHDSKLTQDIESRMLLILSKTVNEAFVTYRYELTADDIERIVDRIKSRIDDEFSQKEKMLLDKMALFSAQKQEKLKVELHGQLKESMKLQQGDVNIVNKNVNIDEILAAILKSDKLISLVDGRIKPLTDNLSNHDKKIDEILAFMANMKLDIENKFKKLSGIEIEQKSLSDNLAAVRLESDSKLKRLSLDIDGKFAKLSDSQYSSIHESVKMTLLNIFGGGSTGDMSDESIRNWINSVFVAKSDLEARLKAMEINGERAFQLQLDKNAGVLMSEINEEIAKQVAIAVVASSKESSGRVGANFQGLSEADVLRIVQKVLAVYDADKTGLVDFALETAGGQVISTRCTENYRTKSAEISIFGIPLWYPSNTPRTVISPSVQPGECWAFQGFPGYLVIKLNNVIHINGFTMEHISQSLAPNGVIDSAPNNFTVWALETEMDQNPTLFGSYQYSAEKDAPSLQYFPVTNNEIAQPYQIIELRVESNHGNPRYTCIYRFRVHGTVMKP